MASDDELPLSPEEQADVDLLAFEIDMHVCAALRDAEVDTTAYALPTTGTYSYRYRDNSKERTEFCAV